MRNWNFRIRIINIFISTRIICNAEGDFTYMQENFKHTKYVHATFYIIWTFLWINYLAKTSIYYKNHVLYIDNSDEKSRFYEYEKKMNERERRNHIFREKNGCYVSIYLVRSPYLILPTRKVNLRVFRFSWCALIQNL